MIATTDELSKAAAAAFDGISPVDYDENKAYGNVLSDEKFGKSQNWDNASSGFIPANTVDSIKEVAYQYDSLRRGVGAGIAEVVKMALDSMSKYNNGYDFDDREILGVIRKIAGRFGRGSFAEIHVEEFIRNETNETILRPNENDENNRVDVRTAETIRQVKLSGTVGNTAAECGYRTDWKKPKESAAKHGESRKVVWVTENGRIFERLPKEERGTVMDAWEELT